MKLLIDIGNTRLKWAFVRNDELGQTGALVHAGAPAALAAQLPSASVQSIWIADVTGAARQPALIEALRGRYGIAPEFARASPSWRELKNAYREPERLGVDRWLAMIAAWHRHRGAAVLVSAGTALTVDLISRSGEHRGGIIAAGLAAQQQTMLATTRFPTRALDDTPFRSTLGDDTESCVRQGALFACVGAIEQVARHAEAEALRLLTGGDAAQLQPHLNAGWEQHPHLVLEGLLALSAPPP